jgi:Bacteriophage Sf6, terminase small subunit-like
MKKAEGVPTAITALPKRQYRLGASKRLKSAFPSLMARLSSGTPLDGMLDALGVDWRVFHDFIQQRPERSQEYSLARRICVEKWVHEIVPMSDAVIGEEMSVVTATRNAVDARKWVAGKLAPREYGDQPGGVVINNQTNVLCVSDDRLKQLQALRQSMLKDSTSVREA